MAWSETVTQLQADIDALAPLPLVHWTFNFSCSATAALVFFLLFSYFEYRKDFDIAEQISFVDDQFKRTTPGFIVFLSLYSVGTGAIAAAIIEMKFGAADPAAAIFLAVIGPYALKDKLMAQWQNDLSKKTKDSLTRERQEIGRQPNDDYSQELLRIRKTIAGEE